MKSIQTMRRPAFLPVLVAVLLAVAAGQAGAQAVRSGPVEARLVAAETSVQPGRPFMVALSLSMDPDWHVYWKNPGDSGLPTTLEWDLPAGFTAGSLQWPVPERFESDGLVTFGYSRQVLLLTEISPPKTATAGGSVVLKAHAGWLACRVECTPGKASLELTLPVNAGTPARDERWERPFAEMKALLPTTAAAGFSATADSRTVTLVGTGSPSSNVAATVPRGFLAVRFYPDASGQVKVSAPQSVTMEGTSLRLGMQREPGAGQLKRLSGLLVTTGFGTRSAIVVDVAVSPVSGAAVLIVTILLAFVGGLILNLMPCVLPVISLKVIAFARHGAGGSHGAGGGARQGVLFSLGVLVSFWIIAGVLIGLRAGGRLLGWGFQFQDPVVVVITAVLFFLIGLNLFGVFDVGTILTKLGGNIRRGGGAAAFLNGVFATAVATPCTAPFMGAAVGYALTHSIGASFAVFSALALGMAAPFLLLSAIPRLVARLPKPGPWMETLRQIMAFPMLAAVVWMASVLAALTGATGVVLLLAAMLAAGLGAWIWGRWGTLSRSTPSRAAAGVLAVLLAVGGTVGAAGLLPRGAATGTGGAIGTGEWTRAAAPAASWEPWSAERLDQLRGNGTAVFVDFTARWCLTCQVNERVALDNSAVRSRFAEAGIATLRADWTDANDAIARALAQFGRASVPLYVYYPAGGKEPVILPELLTPGIVLAALH
jgi:thiol:disulfide interchange protein